LERSDSFRPQNAVALAWSANAEEKIRPHFALPFVIVIRSEWRNISGVMIFFYLGQFVVYAIVAFAMFALEQQLNGPKRKK
jgi:hypothetical protein